MLKYTNYDFYEDEYCGNMPDEDFEKLVARASAEVRKYIMNRDFTGYEEEVQFATCSVTDILYKVEKLEQRINKLVSNEKTDVVISSESVADLSRTFANTTNLKDLEDEIINQKAKIKDEIRKYLIHTGLLYRGD